MFYDPLLAMCTPWALTGGALLLLVYYAWSKTRLRYEGSNIPPFPAPEKPFLGHTLLMRGNILDNFVWMRKKAGDIFSLNILGQLLIVVNGYETMREILVKHAEVTLDRPVDMSSQFLGEENHGLLSSRGHNWKEQRAITHSILREFGMGKSLMADKIATELQMFIEKLRSFEGKAIHLPSISSLAVCNIVCSIAFGNRFDYDDEYYKHMMKNSNAYLEKAPPIWVFYVATFFKKLPGDLFGIKEYEACIKDLNENFCKFQINKVKQDLNDDDEPQNFIAAYLQEMHKREKGEKGTFLDEANLVSLVKSLVVAGTETTSMTLNWCVLYCLHHPEIQEKVFDEIKTQVGTARPPCMSDMPNLPYLSAVIRETQRLATIGPLTARVASHSFEVQGYLIPKDSQLMFNYDTAHRDESVWEKPDQFNPERFLDASGKLLKRNELIPFGIGRHICVGEAMARMELDLFLASMFQRFRFEPEDPGKELPTFKGDLVLVVTPKPFKVRFRERSL
ncbi:hypothetical protein RRG08_013911 [Elysia crispata]|uniref:Cytochrome P450 n=1 Tax=Elysia crispata TaxID=231223 RepID=A0AAE0Z847_9GAST|nr:hypothetical protein RRG08_013911 [Elysia crispata]